MVPPTIIDGATHHLLLDATESILDVDLPRLEPIEWSRDLVTHESGTPGSWDDTHAWSGVLVGDGLLMLVTAGGSAATSLADDAAHLASGGRYATPGVGSSVPGQNFTHGWIKHDLYNQLNGLVGKADMGKFLAALKKGIVGPTGESSIKIFSSPVGKYTHELKIGGSAQRLLGFIDENGVLIFDKFVPGGLH
jgi:hypothetical protein